MKHVPFEEYEALKDEILLGVQCKEDSAMDDNGIRDTYATDENERAAPPHRRHSEADSGIWQIIAGKDQDGNKGL